MLRQILLSALFVACVSAECVFPPEIQGQWSSKFDNWNALTVSASTIVGMKPEERLLDFFCESRNGDTYIIKSSEFSFGSLKFRFYTCLDIVPSEASDILYFRTLTEPNGNHGNFSVVSFQTSDTWNETDVCQKNSTAVPLHYDVFMRNGFENNVQNDRCPRALHAHFAANFSDPLENAKCPEGFMIDGCNNRSHLTFNYSECSGDMSSNGAPTYLCLTSMNVDNTTYTTIYLPPAGGAVASAYEISCLEQTMADGQVDIVKSAGSCGAMQAVEIMANETVSCRQEIVTTTEAGTNTSTPVPPSGSTNPVGDGNDAPAIVSGLTTFLLAVVCSVLASSFP